jgi:hypothetical protein
MDPDERVMDVVRLAFRKFRELGSVRQVVLWYQQSNIQVPVLRQGARGSHVGWRSPAYHSIHGILRHPMYAGAYVFGRKGQRSEIVDGRARKTDGHAKPRSEWSVLLRDHHPGYITWEEYEANQLLMAENAHMQKRAARKSARGGRALLTGLIRCGRCARMLRVLYGTQTGHSHRYQCRGEDAQVRAGVCVAMGGVRLDRAVAEKLVEVVSPYAVEAAIAATERATKANDDVRESLVRELDEAKYEADLAGRRHAAVDPAKRLVARELEARWDAALTRVRQIEDRIAEVDTRTASQPPIDHDALLALAQDLPAAWNAPSATIRTKQRIVRILIREIVLDLDDASNEAVATIHWTGGRHTEVRVARVRVGRYLGDRHPSAVAVVRKMGGKWPDRQLAVTLNRMRCKKPDGGTWKTLAVRELRERLGIADFDPDAPRQETISLDETARRLGICVGSVLRLIRDRVLPASQVMPGAPWQISVAALSSERVKIGVRSVVERRSRNLADLQDARTLRLPGL